MQTRNYLIGHLGRVTLVTASIMLGMALAAPPTPPHPTQLPTGGKVVAGQATISQTGATLNVHQSSPHAVLSWSTFNVGAHATVNFFHLSPYSTTLNHVQDAHLSQIFGHINANGQIFLTNPRGLYFGPSARVNAGALTATTHDITNTDFMAGHYRFTRGGASGSVVNEGTLTAALEGYIALLAPEVRNQGVIVAQLGTVALAAGEAYTLHLDDGRLTNIQVEAAQIATLVENGHAVQAPGGRIILSAHGANALQRSSIRHTGTSDARGISEVGGRIYLTAEGGAVSVAGTLDASSSVASGGHIQVTGTSVHVEDGAHLTASGATGGGTVLAGGSWQNTDPTVSQAVTTTIAPTAHLEANATDRGDGGTVVAWSDIHNLESATRAYGRFEAIGGPNGGNGGRLETSGHWLDTTGISVATKGRAGLSGLWLLDPYTVTIGGSTSGTAFPSVAPFSFTPSATSTILASAITTALQNGNNVTVATGDGSTQSTGGDIKVTSSITPTLNAGDVTLRLNANRRILVDSVSIVATGANKLNLHLNPNRNTAQDGGDVVIDSYSILKTNGGEFKALGGVNFDSYLRGYNGSERTSTDTVYGTTGFYMTNAALMTAGGDITLKVKSGAYSGTSQTEALQMYASSFSSGAGNITLWGEANTPSSTGIVRGVNLWGNGNDGSSASTRLSSYTLEATTGNIQVTGIAKAGQNNAYGDGVYFTSGAGTGGKIYTASGSLSLYGETNIPSSRGVSTQGSNDALIATNSGNISITSKNTAVESWKGGLFLDSVESTTGTITAITNGSIVLYDPLISGASGTAITLHGRSLTTDSGSGATITTANGRALFFGETGATVHSSFSFPNTTPTPCGYSGSTTACATSGTAIPSTGNRFLTGTGTVSFANPNSLLVPTVSGLSNQTKTFGGAAYTQAATVTEGAGTISYASSNTAVATVNSSTGTVTIVGAGSATLTASVASNASYSATSGSYTLTVDKGTPTVTAGSALSKTYGNAAYTQAATVTEGAGTISYASSNTAVATVNSSTGTVTIVGAGSATLTATAASNTNYNAASGAYTLTVAQAAAAAASKRATNSRATAAIVLAFTRPIYAPPAIARPMGNTPVATTRPADAPPSIPQPAGGLAGNTPAAITPDFAPLKAPPATTRPADAPLTNPG